MRLTTQVRFALLFIVVMGMASVAISVWSFYQSKVYIERINLANSEYNTLRLLESHTYQLFKRYTDALLDSDERPDDSSDKPSEQAQALVLLLREDIATARAVIQEEIDLIGPREIAKLEALDDIELNVELLVQRLERLRSGQEAGEIDVTWADLSAIIESDINREFKRQTQLALAQGSLEIENTLESVDREMFRFEVFSILFAAIAVAAAFASVSIMRARISRPATNLLRGVREFGEGNLGYRTGLSGVDEISTIGMTFDLMAQRIGEKTQALASDNQHLEEVVADRTRQLERLLGEVRRVDNKRRKMMADVSHELRTPLTIIKGEADIALRGVEKPVEIYRDALDRAREAATHTARIVDDLLFVARSETGDTQLTVESTDLYSVVAETVNSFARDISLTSDVDSADIQGDSGRIRQALLVLLENARHHGQSEVSVHLTQAQDGYSVAIEDSGPGMSAADKQHAFERFYRGSDAARRYKEGTGLGLPVAQSIAEAHGGKISLEDRSGGGLRAVLYLPSKPVLRVVA